MPAYPRFMDLKEPVSLDTPIAADRLTRGQPKSGTISTSENNDKKFYCGQWAADVGAWRVSYTEEELCVILSGSGKLIAEDGTIFPFKAGDAFVIPSGFKGEWDNAEPVRKIYAIVE